jgi:hypothetical protein
MGWTAWDSNPGRAKRLLFFKMFRPALVPTLPPIHWIPGFFPRVKVAGALS